MNSNGFHLRKMGGAERVGAFLVSGLFLGVLPIELFLGTRVPFPFILYTILAFCVVVLLRWDRLQSTWLALVGRGSKREATFLALMGAMIFWFGLQAFVSPCPQYAQRKYVLWALHTILPLIVGYLWIDKPETVGGILRAGMIWIALVPIFWLANPDAIAQLDARHIILRSEFSELTSCSFCRAVSLAAMAGVVSVGIRVFTGLAVLVPIGLIPVLLYLTLQSGSRGAVLSFAVAASVFVVLSANRRRLLLLAILAPVVGGMLFNYVATTNSVTGIVDSGLLDGDVRDGSVLEHFAAWRLSIATAVKRPLGIGFGGFPHLAGHQDEPLYPHNAVLEVWVENGLIGLGLYLCLIALPFAFLGRRQFADGRIIALGSLFLVTFLFAMTYLGVEGNNPYGLFLGGLWALSAQVRAGPLSTGVRNITTFPLPFETDRFAGEPVSVVPAEGSRPSDGCRIIPARSSGHADHSPADPVLP